MDMYYYERRKLSPEGVALRLDYEALPGHQLWELSKHLCPAGTNAEDRLNALIAHWNVEGRRSHDAAETSCIWEYVARPDITAAAAAAKRR